MSDVEHLFSRNISREYLKNMIYGWIIKILNFKNFRRNRQFQFVGRPDKIENKRKITKHIAHLIYRSNQTSLSDFGVKLDEFTTDVATYRQITHPAYLMVV